MSWLKYQQSRGLLLASHQVRREYKPVLLSTALITAHVADWDFKQAIRLTESLDKAERDALRSNRALQILLHFTSLQPRPRARLSFTRWIVFSSKTTNALGWH